MAASSTSSGFHTRIEDILSHLPVSGTTEFGKGQMIYGQDKLSESIYLVISGKVGISQIAENGSEVLLEIVQPDGLFGESAFLDFSRRSEQATAIERAKLMTWAVSDMEDLVMKRPRLAVGMLQILAQRNADFTRRIESLAVDSVERRLARSLLHFSERLGSPEADGSVRMMPFTHEMLSRYVGTTREVVTQYMNRFRNQGYLTYSRQGIHLYRDALRTVFERSSSLSAGTSS
ncbi:MAG TPA: Crp/Fnr family transcriptional regulator [Candidatus Acidoferrales bacterium]|jgi:CRP/FNR family cyclic AMP-dependent transcriptional regulator|nr:Crp/Fnr family transcriptional regulator [Candidatus Acidoferrales bacterium]